MRVSQIMSDATARRYRAAARRPPAIWASRGMTTAASNIVTLRHASAPLSTVVGLGRVLLSARSRRYRAAA